MPASGVLAPADVIHPCSDTLSEPGISLGSVGRRPPGGAVDALGEEEEEEAPLELRRPKALAPRVLPGSRRQTAWICSCV